MPDAFAGPISELAEAIFRQREPTVDGINALRNIEIVEAVYASNKTGRAVNPGAASLGTAKTCAGSIRAGEHGIEDVI
jgi:hypothetical protein